MVIKNFLFNKLCNLILYLIILEEEEENAESDANNEMETENNDEQWRIKMQNLIKIIYNVV